MKSLVHKVALVLGGFCVVFSASANLPGGGTGAGPNVTLTDNGNGTVTLANGIVSIVCNKTSGVIGQINYTFNNTGSSQTLNLLAGGHNGGQLYWEDNNNQGLTFSYSVISDPAANGGNYAEIALTTTTVANIALEVHYSLLRGSTGFYVTAIYAHRSTDSSFSFGECRDNIYAGAMFNWMSVDARRNRLMEVQSTAGAIPVFGAPQEVTLWTNGIYAGQYEDKYKYSADLGVNHVWGWSSVGAGGKNVGLWNISASSEYYNGGPLKRELMEHIGTTILNMLNGGHYGQGGDGSFASGEVWTKVYGPYFIYCNNISSAITGTNAAAQALYNDALAQGAAEQSAWPYSWFTNSNYAPAAQRGTVTGQIVIDDSGNPNASASNLWVGLVRQPSTTTSTYDFQAWMKPYQFWAKTDANGNFTISNIIATNNYTLYAFGPGAPEIFMSQSQAGGAPPLLCDLPASPFAVTVTGGATNNLGTVTWTPARVGATVFQIGYPDRSSGEFRHGDDWWVGDIGPNPSDPSPIWSKWLEYPFDFPSGPNYVVGQSRWTTDWNFVQPVVTSSTGTYNNSSSTITFNLATAPANGAQASLYLGLSSDYYAAIIVTVNGHNLGSVSGVTGSPNNSIPTTGYYTGYSKSDTTIREGNQAMASDERLTFPASILQQGQNTVSIGIRQVGGSYFADHAMYDYIRLELTGYIPPAPTSVDAFPGNNANLVCWPVTPGATSYNILRSTTSGSGYASVASGVVGPVCGSGPNNATYLDAAATNGTTYYYVVQSVNPTGVSADSPQSSGAMPGATISTSAPAAPDGLIVSSVGHHSVTLNWSGSSGASFYTIYRSTLVNNGGGASNVLSTIVLANNVTSTSYTDNSPTDGSIYKYFLTATDAGGTSVDSSSAIGVPLPAPPSGAPGSLTATPSGANITLNWSAVPGAVGYVIKRSTSLNGGYVLLNSITETTYTDSGLDTNSTYYYQITPMNAGGTGTTGATTTKPPAPTSLRAVAGDTKVFLAWPASVGATGYVIKRGTSSGNETTTVATSLTGTNYIDAGLNNGTTYYYVVSAEGSGANSGNSPEASATPNSTTSPAIAKIAVSDNVLTLSGAGGFPTSTYYVLATTNLTLPATEWMPVATNQFDTGGNFIITNGVNPAWPQTFYRLELQ
jgi:fibronectin type 3 domain-containing protein